MLGADAKRLPGGASLYISRDPIPVGRERYIAR